MRREWEDALLAGDIESLATQLEAGNDIDARDRHGQTGLMVATRRGDGETVSWLIEHGAALDHTAKFGLSALMLAVLNGHREVARALIAAGADVTLRGSGAPGFAGKAAHDLAVERGDDVLAPLLQGDDPG